MRASFSTQNKADYLVDPRFPGKFEGITKFRGWRRIFVYRPMEAKHHLVYQEKKAEHECGGLLGLGTDKSKTTVTFN